MKVGTVDGSQMLGSSYVGPEFKNKEIKLEGFCPTPDGFRLAHRQPQGSFAPYTKFT